MGKMMAQQDQDVENRLKCLNRSELAELLEFVIPNRRAEGFVVETNENVPTSPLARPH